MSKVDLFKKWDAKNYGRISEQFMPGPMHNPNPGSRERAENTLLDEIGKLDDILMNTKNQKASLEWDRIVDNQYLTGDEHEYWKDLSEDELQRAVNDALSIIKKHGLQTED